MARGRTETGELEVRVVLQVRIDRDRWAVEQMDSDPDETLDRDIRKDVKKFVRDYITGGAEMQLGDVPIYSVIAEGIYS